MALEFGRAADDSQGVGRDTRLDAGGSCGVLGGHGDLRLKQYGILRPLTFLLKKLREMSAKEKVLNSAVLSAAFRQRLWDSVEDHRDPFSPGLRRVPVSSHDEILFALY